MTAQTITNNGFLNEFKRRNDQMQDRPFCWILGSGASVQSGIPTGKALSYQWLKELHELEDFNSLPIEEWANAENLRIPQFDLGRAADFYPWIYQRRFQDYPEQGYAFLENVMARAEPSFGYSVLAQIMALTPHKVAVTTNFDNLIADALSIYTRTFPLVCGHESLTGYIRPNLRRPLVAKIHRDLLLAPLSNPEEIAKLPGEWASALTKIFDRFTPIVIGYGGNDGSLMGFLNTLNPIEGGMFWAYREGTAIDPKIHSVLKHHRGRLVPIAGFDEVMLQLQEKLQLPFLLPELQRVHDKRASDYQKQFSTLTATLRKPADDPAAEEARIPVRKAAEAAVERLTKEKDWWAWELKADAEKDPDKQEAIYIAGLEDFPDSPDLTGNYAVFQEKTRKNSGRADHLYQKAYKLNPEDATHVGNFAWSLHSYRKDYDGAEKLYRKAMDLDPSHPNNTHNFALFMKDVRKDYDQAETLYLKAVELDPNHAGNIGGIAVFMEKVRKNYGEAERLFRKALELDPEHAPTKVNFAQFLGATDRIDEAYEIATGAWELLDNVPHDAHAETAFTRWLLDRASGRSGTPALGRLKTVLLAGFERSPWSFDALLAALTPKLVDEDQTLARRLAEAILDEGKVAALDQESIWKSVDPIPLDARWP